MALAKPQLGPDAAPPAPRPRAWRPRAWHHWGHARRWGLSRFSIAALMVALLIAAPIGAVALQGLGTGINGWLQLWATVLPRYLLNTFWLALGVGIGVSIIGTGTAWLVTMCRFPGRQIFEWALVIPLAVPAYVMAYAYTDFLQHAGPLQTLLRDVFALGPRDYWFPNVRSLPGAILMFTFVLYPYVYLLSRAAFLQQSACVIEVARTLGASPWRTFREIAIPLARPAIAGGTALALMETLADFGTVAHFSVQTFTTGIYRAWFSFGDRPLAAQLALTLLVVVIVTMTVERMARGRAQYNLSSERYRPLPRFALKGAGAVGAIVACTIPVTIGFLLPAAILGEMALSNGHNLFSARYMELTLNSLTLAGAAAIVAVIIATFLLYARRVAPGLLSHMAARVGQLGYAVPGSIIAVGILVPLAAFDNSLDAWMRASFGISTGLLLTGSLAALVFAYVVRFLAIAMQSVDASLHKVTPNMESAARSLGAGRWRTLREVHLPLLRGGLMTAGLIVFVEVMKELPATLLMRPFNFDTLAVQAYRLASDERLTEASTAALVIVLAGLLPVILLTRSIAQSRPGAAPGSSVVTPEQLPAD